MMWWCLLHKWMTLVSIAVLHGQHGCHKCSSVAHKAETLLDVKLPWVHCNMWGVIDLWFPPIKQSNFWFRSLLIWFKWFSFANVLQLQKNWNKYKKFLYQNVSFLGGCSSVSPPFHSYSFRSLAGTLCIMWCCNYTVWTIVTLEYVGNIVWKGFRIAVWMAKQLTKISLL